MTEKNIHQRIAAVMEAVSYIQREEKKGMTYRVVSHDKVTALLRPEMMKNGVCCYPVRCDHTHNGNRAECSMTVRFVNVDMPTDFIDVQSFGYGVDPQDKGPGKAMSYAVKYALLKTFCLETGDDPDNESIAHTKEDPHVPYDPAPHIAAISEATTGMALLAALDKPGCDNNNPLIIAARVDRLRVFVKGAQSVAVLDAFSKKFGPDWPKVSADADARRTELTQQSEAA